MNRVLQVVLTGNASNLRGVLAQSAAEVKAYTRTVERANDTVAASATRAHTGMRALAVGAGVLALALGYGVAKAVEFEASMRNVNSLARLSEGGLAALSDQVIAMSTRLPQSANVLAEGLYDVIGSGFEAADALTVLDAAASAASAGLTTTEVAARAIGGVLNAYGLEAADAADVSDVLFQTVNLGVLSFDELAGSIGDTVGTAAAAKVGIDQVGAAIATMTLTGINGAESATSLNNLLQSMLKPSEALADAYKGLGYESGEQALKTDGLRVVMDRLRQSTGGNVTQLLELFPNIRAARGALALMSAEGENYARVSEELEDKNARQGATQRVLAEQMKAAGNQWTLLKNGFDAGAIVIGTKVLPALTGLMGVLRQVGGFVGDVATDVSGRLAPAWDLLARTGEAVWEVLEAIYDAASPIAGVLIKIGGGAVVGAIMVLLSILADTAEFLAENKELAVVLAVVMAVQLTGGIGAAQAAMWRFVGTPVVLFLSSILSGATAVGTFFSGGFVAALGTARAALMSLMSAAAPLAAVGAVVYAVTKLVDFASAAGEAREEMADMWDAVGDAKGNTAKVAALGRMVQDLRSKIEDLVASTDIDSGGLLGPLFMIENGGDLDRIGVYKDSLDAAREAQARASESAAILADQYSTTKDRVIELADKHGVDLTGALNESIRLFQNYQSLEAADAKAEQVQALIDALGTMADETSTVTERVEALKTALDLLGGKEISVFEATSALQEVVASSVGALEGLTGEVLNAEGGLNAYSEAGRRAGEILTDYREKADDLTTTMVDQGYSFEEVQKAQADLRADFIKTANNMGITGAAAELLADKVLGVPSEREVLIRAAISDAAAKIELIKQQMAALQDKDVTVRMAIVMGRTPAEIQHLLNKPGFVGFHGGVHGRSAAPQWTRLEKYDTGGVRDRWGPVAWTPGGPMPTVPMIAAEHPGGGLINWAEPGTGGEALVPMGMRNRERSKELVAYLAREFGMNSYAVGGFTPAASPSYQPTVRAGASVGYSQDAPVFEIRAEVRVGDRVVTDLVDTRVDVKLKETVRTARAAGRGRGR